MKLKTKTPNTNLYDHDYKLFYFSEEEIQKEYEFFFKYIEHKRRYKHVFRVNKKGRILFREKNKYCPCCYSKDVVKNGFNTRKLHILGEGYCTVYINRYYCKSCGCNYQTDMNEFVEYGYNITREVKEIIWINYAYYMGSVRKIATVLRKTHNIHLSYQSIQNIICQFNYNNNQQIKSYSGYYVFDSLWVKISGKWKYMLALMDGQHNTIINTKIVEEERSKNIKEFLRNSTRNQERKTVTTDLKHDYGKPIDQLKMKQQLCKFHTQQNINKKIKEYSKKNKLNNEEIEELYKQKDEINNIINTTDYNQSLNNIQNILKKPKEYYTVIYSICKDFLRPYLRNITQYMENPKIESTSNKIENMFQKIMPKHIKKRMKTEKGLESRFMLCLWRWDQDNLII